MASIENRKSPNRKSNGSALVITLLLLVIITILVAALASVIFGENRSARLALDSQRASLLSTIALDDAMDRIQSALEPFDDPFSASAQTPGVFWSLAPGRIDHYPLKAGNARPVSSKTFELHSGAPFGLAAEQVVDLNRATSNGIRPIDNLLPADKKMDVAWIRVLADPSNPPGKDNPIIGRYAFWVDDEGAKINVNTADGTEKYKNNNRYSYGMGTPTEVSLEALEGLTLEGAEAIAARARAGGFATPGELRQVPGVPESLFTDNNFSLTAYNRSPEFSIFNEPRLQLVTTDVHGLDGNSPANGAVGSLMYVTGNQVFNRLLGEYGYKMRTGNLLSRTPLRSVYPTPNQIGHPTLKTAWPLVPRLGIDTEPSGYRWNHTASTMLVKSSIQTSATASSWNGWNNLVSPQWTRTLEQTARQLTGVNLKGETVEWPFTQSNFANPDPAGPEGKYNLRQIDSITVQLFDLVRMATPYPFEGQGGVGMVLPTFALFGLLQDQPVFGIGLTPRFTEVFGRFSMTRTLDANGNLLSGFLQGGIWVEAYFPAGSFQPGQAAGMQYGNFENQLRFGQTAGAPGGNGLPTSILNSIDAPRQVLDGVDYPPNVGAGGSQLGGEENPNSFWMDNLLDARDQNGGPAGIDFWGNSKDFPDPDQAKAARFRNPPSPARDDGLYPGAGPGGRRTNNADGRITPIAAPLFRMSQLYRSTNQNDVGAWAPGMYAITRSMNATQNYKLRDPVGGAAAITSVTLSGHLSLIRQWFTLAANGRGIEDVAPLDGMRGPAFSTVNSGANPNFSRPPGPYEPDTGLPIPEMTVSPGNPKVFHLRVLDPMVNKNVGDWIPADNTTKLTMPTLTSNLNANPPPHWAPNAAENDADGNPIPNDLASCWGPGVYNVGTGSAWANWNTQSNFPSIGALHYIRTKAMPDTGTNKGVPFRLLSFAPADDLTQSDIPDWAMLDLFTVPAGRWCLPASAYAYKATPDPAEANARFAYASFFGGNAGAYVSFTYGGATSGRVNVNGCVLYPWAEAADAADRLPDRLTPLEAVFYGLRYNRDGKMTVDPTTWQVTSLEPPITHEQAGTVADAIADYIQQHGPLAMPGEVCDVPELSADFGATVNPTRNDVIAQALGNLTAQGNVFSVWVTAQAVQKIPAHTDYGEFESGDRVLAERRMRFIIERLVDPGIDGVPGNTASITISATNDGVVGTLDDPVNAQYHPASPKFVYRVISVEENR